MHYSSQSQWWTNFHRLGRKIGAKDSIPDANDIKRAALLRQQAREGQFCSNPAIVAAAEEMDWVIDYGREAFEAELARRKAEKGMGS